MTLSRVYRVYRVLHLLASGLFCGSFNICQSRSLPSSVQSRDISQSEWRVEWPVASHSSARAQHTSSHSASWLLQSPSSPVILQEDPSAVRRAIEKYFSPAKLLRIRTCLHLINNQVGKIFIQYFDVKRIKNMICRRS